MMSEFSPNELADLFADTLAEIVTKISGFSLNILSAEPSDHFDGIVSFMPLDDATLFISAGEADMRVIYTAVTGVAPDEVTEEDARDALCELVNMTAGNIKLRLGKPELTFALSTPLLITGEHMSFTTKKRVHVVSRLLGDGEIALNVKIVCAAG